MPAKRGVRESRWQLASPRRLTGASHRPPDISVSVAQLDLRLILGTQADQEELGRGDAGFLKPLGAGHRYARRRPHPSRGHAVGLCAMERKEVAYQFSSALGVEHAERTDRALSAIIGKSLTYRDSSRAAK
jgi:hypothetical protein